MPPALGSDRTRCSGSRAARDRAPPRARRGRRRPARCACRSSAPGFGSRPRMSSLKSAATRFRRQIATGVFLDAAAPAGRLAGTVAGASENSRKHVRAPIDHVGVAVAALGDQSDVFRNGRVGRAGPLAVDDFVEVVGRRNVCWFHSTPRARARSSQNSRRARVTSASGQVHPPRSDHKLPNPLWNFTRQNLQIPPPVERHACRLLTQPAGRFVGCQSGATMAARFRPNLLPFGVPEWLVMRPARTRRSFVAPHNRTPCAISSRTFSRTSRSIRPNRRGAPCGRTCGRASTRQASVGRGRRTASPSCSTAGRCGRRRGGRWPRRCAPWREALAAEWDAQQDKVDPGRDAADPARQLDHRRRCAAPAPVAAEIEKYLGTDLLFYRAAEPAGLVESQRRHWDPVLEWARETLGARFVLAEGVMHVAQPEAAIAAARAAIPNGADIARRGGSARSMSSPR